MDTTNDSSPRSDEAPPPESDDFEPQRLRRLPDMRRAKDGRMVAGVCEGAGRYVNIDPVIIRIVIATLSFFGFAGVILYGAAWLLIPEEDADTSIAARTFNLGDNEEQIRVVGLVSAAIIAIVFASNMVGGAWNTPFPYFGLVLLGLLWLFVIRPRQRGARTDGETTSPAESTGTLSAPAAAEQSVRSSGAPDRPRNPRHDRGILTLLTLFSAMIAVGGIAVYALVQDPVDSAVYPAAVLAVITLGLLVGTFVGNGRPLIPLGVLAAAALLVVAALPSATVGQRLPTPPTAADVEDSYTLGAGQTVLDLSQVSDLGDLDGRTVSAEVGVGSLRVIVPRDLDVDVDAQVRAGESRVFGIVRNGSDVDYSYVDTVDNGPDLTLDLTTTLGEIEVTRR